ncbi:hypothetical protein VXE65_19230 [Mycolicibacterium conceptionense]|uniref:hypothetical protein n=1 Tax=Mycolicibacterium conceptionense TaxID=451644 RepID=UPI0032046D1F
MAFTVKFTHEEAKEFAGPHDSFSIDPAGVLHLSYVEAASGLGQSQDVTRSLSPHAWLEVIHTEPMPAISAVRGTHPGHPF